MLMGSPMECGQHQNWCRGPDKKHLAIEYTQEGPEFATSFIIADAVLQSLSSRISAILGSTGSSETRRKYRSPPPENPLRAGRSEPGAPSSPGARRSGASPASTPNNTVVLYRTDALVSPLTGTSSATSIKSDPCGVVAQTFAEQTVIQIVLMMQQQLLREEARLRSFGQVIPFST